jgi:hypothetical protein
LSPPRGSDTFPFPARSVGSRTGVECPAGSAYRGRAPLGNHDPRGDRRTGIFRPRSTRPGRKETYLRSERHPADRQCWWHDHGPMLFRGEGGRRRTSICQRRRECDSPLQERAPRYFASLRSHSSRSLRTLHRGAEGGRAHCLTDAKQSHRRCGLHASVRRAELHVLRRGPRTALSIALYRNTASNLNSPHFLLAVKVPLPNSPYSAVHFILAAPSRQT